MFILKIKTWYFSLSCHPRIEREGKNHKGRETSGEATRRASSHEDCTKVQRTGRRDRGKQKGERQPEMKRLCTVIPDKVERGRFILRGKEYIFVVDTFRGPQFAYFKRIHFREGN